MKYLVLSLVMVLALGSVAEAKNVEYQSCTLDSYLASLLVNIDDAALAAKPSIERTIWDAFHGVAKLVTAEVLTSAEGFVLFRDAVGAEIWKVIGLYGPPEISAGDCKQA